MENRLMIALFNPCRFASERNRQIYAKPVVIAGETVITVITVNNFGGSAAGWHVSGQIFKNGRPVNLFARLDRAALAAVAARLKSFLDDAGEGPIRQNNTLLEFNYYKMLSDEERSRMR